VADTIRTKIISSATDNLAKLRMSMPASGDPTVVVNLAGLGRTVIIARTQKGLGAGNKPFSDYKPGTYYAPVDKRPPGYPQPSGGRTKHLRTGKPLKSVAYGSYGDYKRGIGRSGRPDLTISGKMLGAIQIATVSAREAHLFFAGREEAAKAHGHEFGTTTTARPFFDLSDYASESQLRLAAFNELRDLARRAKLELKGRAV
jgi:hypothetical protein